MEFPMIECLEENGYDISYVSQTDVAQPAPRRCSSSTRYS